MSSPKVLSSKKNFTTVNDSWEAYYSENKFAISEEVTKALKYVPIYYQKRNRSVMSAAYSLWNGTEQRFEVFCPRNSVFRSTNLHELGHIYFGHLKNSRKYIAMAEKMLKPYIDEIANFLDISTWNVIHDVINICMDFEINSKFFVTKKEREELNASVQFFLLRRDDTADIRSKLNEFSPDILDKSTVIYFPENFGFPGKKSFLEYIQMIIDYCVNHKKPEVPKNETANTGSNHQSNDEQHSGPSITLPSENNDNNNKEENNENDNDNEASSPFTEEDDNDSDKLNDLPSFDEKSDDQIPSEEIPQIEDVDDQTFAKRFSTNCKTEQFKDKIKREDESRKSPIYEINGETLDNEINTADEWMRRHDEEEEEISLLKDKIDIASNASEINEFILKNAIPSVDIKSYNDILYNYNRGKTTDVFINKVRTRSTFRKPNVHIYTDISGSMDADYTKKIVKAVKAISSRIDNRSSITFYNNWDRNTEKFATLTDDVINQSFTGGGTHLARSLKYSYIKTQENNSANTLVIISDFCDDLREIKKSFDNIKSTILCIEVGNSNTTHISDEFKNYNINNVKLLKIVDRKFAA